MLPSEPERSGAPLPMSSTSGLPALWPNSGRVPSRCVCVRNAVPSGIDRRVIGAVAGTGCLDRIHRFDAVVTQADLETRHATSVLQRTDARRAMRTLSHLRACPTCWVGALDTRPRRLARVTILPAAHGQCRSGSICSISPEAGKRFLARDECARDECRRSHLSCDRIDVDCSIRWRWVPRRSPHPKNKDARTARDRPPEAAFSPGWPGGGLSLSILKTCTRIRF